MLSSGKGRFAGRYQHNLDAKNRLTVPSKWRFEGDEGVQYLAVANPAGCITFYDPERVRRLEEKLDEVSMMDAEEHEALMEFFETADFVSCDKSGRIGLKEDLLEHAGLKKEVVLVGMVKSFHVWAPERYEEVSKRRKDNKERHKRILREMGI